MPSQQSPPSSSAENEEVYPDNKFMDKYWQYFPRIGISPSSFPEVIIFIIGFLFVGFFYTFIYIGFATFRLLVQAIKASFTIRVKSY